MQDQPSAGYGYCQCGCGQQTKRHTYTSRTRGFVKDQPKRFVYGHNRRKPQPWTIEDRGHDTPCWIWQQYINPKGYGRAHLDYKSLPAHQLTYEQQNGPVPSGMQLDHLCRVRCCVNPAHLEPVTNAENSRRGRNTKLTYEEARAIKRLLSAGGLSQARIAQRFGICQAQVSKIGLGECWSDA